MPRAACTMSLAARECRALAHGQPTANIRLPVPHSDRTVKQPRYDCDYDYDDD